jgi:hypothetical protein
MTVMHSRSAREFTIHLAMNGPDAASFAQQGASDPAVAAPKLWRSN